MSLQLEFDDLDKYLLAQKGRIIHQIWFGTIPNKREAKKAYQKMKLYRDSWIKHNPTWCRFEWNKQNCIFLIKKYYSEHLDLFLKYSFEIQRCDFARYIILHRYGGWYVDMDYYCNKPLDEAMKEYTNDIYFVQSPNSSFLQEDDHISNSLMYSIPNHSYWRRVCIDLEKAKDVPYFYTKHLKVMFTTGPGILNRIYTINKYKYKVKSLPWKLFHPYGIKDDKLFLKNDTKVYAIHIGKGSWENRDSKILLFIARNWQMILLIILAFFIPKLIFKIYYY
jgi:mannosyltransferase OCH1-like enzyme